MNGPIAGTYTAAMESGTIVLLPAFNEAAHIEEVIAGVYRAASGANVVVVDDGSNDGTGDRARSAGATVVRMPTNMGYGVALQAGYKYAMREGAEYVVQLDADGQHDPIAIPRLVERVARGDIDLCIGSRFLEGESYAIPTTRRAGMILFRRIASMVLGTTITDPTSGYQAMNRRVVEFYCRDAYPTDYPDVNVLVMLHRHGFRIAELPVEMFASADNKSIHAGVRPAYYLFKMGLDIPLNLLRREH